MLVVSVFLETVRCNRMANETEKQVVDIHNQMNILTSSRSHKVEPIFALHFEWAYLVHA